MALKAVGHLVGSGSWTAGSILVNPGDQTVVVDTGALGAASYLFAVSGSCDAAWVYDVQWVDSDGTSVLNAQRRRGAANATDDFLFPNKLTLTANQRVRCVLQGAIVATALQMSIFVQEVG
jgi:hypothetical protein